MRVLPIRIRPLRVGDIVRVGRPVLDAPADSIAVVVEVYDRRIMGADGFGVTLLFQSGTFDGFSPDDLTVCHVERVAHNPRLAGYSWTSAVRLIADWADGRFDAVWHDPTLYDDDIPKPPTPDTGTEQNGDA